MTGYRAVTGAAYCGGMFKWIATVGCLVALAGPCRAQGVAAFETGNKLLLDCQNQFGAAHLFCQGFAAAVADEMLSAMAAGDTVLGWRACFPTDVALGQITDVATRFLTVHPELRHLTALGLFAEAFADAFPCSSASR